MDVKLDQADAEELLRRLYMPEKDRNDRTVYVIDPSLACTLRVALHAALGK